jgi:hypothetical protein
MAAFGRAKPRLATVFRQPFQCHVCEGRTFLDREVKLNTSGMEFLGLAWANPSAVGLVCLTCGYVHLFVEGPLELWKEDGGYPEEDEA